MESKKSKAALGILAYAAAAQIHPKFSGPKFTRLQRIKMSFNIWSSKKHSHERENARRRRQIERGIIKVTM